MREGMEMVFCCQILFAAQMLYDHTYNRDLEYIPARNRALTRYPVPKSLNHTISIILILLQANLPHSLSGPHSPAQREQYNLCFRL